MSRIAILFTDYHIDFSPTVLQLMKQLSLSNEVRVFCFRSSDQEPLGRSFSEFEVLGAGKFEDRIIGWISRAVRKLSVWRGIPPHRMQDMGRTIRGMFMKRRLRQWVPDHVIAVDFRAANIAVRSGYQTDLLSLELPDKTQENYLNIRFSQIGAVLIQSKERLSYLFPEGGQKWFLLPNSQPLDLEAWNRSDREGLVYCGAPQPIFGIEETLDYIAQYPDRPLTVKGRGAAEVLSKRGGVGCRLKVEEAYTPLEELAQSLSRFRIGFCFYILEKIDEKWLNRYNYETAPSGKLFSFLSAGVPVVCSRISGLQMVEDYQAGVLVEDHRPETIEAAVVKIESDYEWYREGARRLCEAMDFKKHAEVYIEDLSERLNRKKGSS